LRKREKTFIMRTIHTLTKTDLEKLRKVFREELQASMLPLHKDLDSILEQFHSVNQLHDILRHLLHYMKDMKARMELMEEEVISHYS